VYPFDLLAHPVSSSLVVLSGCQTGDPGLYYDNTSLSLAQTTLLAGAKQVIASYWPVSDIITGELMRDFYRHFVSGGSIYQSLQTAMRNTRRRTSDIRTWAPFYLIGG
jgi:CHAT domain-containing protein